jgi:FkbM family methyltransferase
MTIQTRVIDGIIFSFVNEREFNLIYKDIFKYNGYQFIADKPNPIILDCGAHIGISVLYFKKFYPQARIVAFEPNPETFKLLKLNIEQNNVNNVKIINAAVANNIDNIDFYICSEIFTDELTWAWGFAGIKNAWYDSNIYKTIKVPAVKLSSHIHRNIDLLKLDIEGMEEIVLKEISHKMNFVRKIIMEFHGNALDEVNSLEEILTLIKDNQFTFEMRQIKRVTLEDIDRTGPFKVKLIIERR